MSCSGDVLIAALQGGGQRPPLQQKMKRPTIEPEPVQFPALSKRGARRAIQRALVLAGRERAIRQHLREAELTTLWVIEDWGLEWTVVFDHGRLEFHRGRAGKPRLTYAWRTADDFFSRLEAAAPDAFSDECSGDPTVRKFAEPVLAAFAGALRTVLANPVDDDGEPLL
jgi:hypothetical protein